MFAVRNLTKTVAFSATKFVAPAAKNSFALRNFSMHFAKSHEYCNIEGDIATIGISDHAAEALGDVVFVELPAVGSVFQAGDNMASVESVKAASDVYMPIGGEVIEINEVLESAPGTVNESPFDKGWFVKIRVSDPEETKALLDEAAYAEHKESEEH